MPCPAWSGKIKAGTEVISFTLGVVLIFAGIAGSQSYSTDVEKQLKAGDRFQLRGYDITFEKLFGSSQNDTKERVVAQLGIERDGKRCLSAIRKRNFTRGRINRFLKWTLVHAQRRLVHDPGGF